MPTPRAEGFRIGMNHGKLLSPEDTRECALRNHIYMLGMMELDTTKGKRPLRVFGYEVPSERATRGLTMDLLAYDMQHNLYVVELKRAKNSERLGKVIDQVSRYACQNMPVIQSDLEAEFRDRFFLGIRFGEVRPMVLAPEHYYREALRRGRVTARAPEVLGHMLKEHLDRVLFGCFLEKDLANCLGKGIPLSVHLIDSEERLNNKLHEWAK